MDFERGSVPIEFHCAPAFETLVYKVELTHRLDASPSCCQFPFRRDSLRYPRSYKVFVDFLLAQLPVVHSDDAD